MDNNPKFKYMQIHGYQLARKVKDGRIRERKSCYVDELMGVDTKCEDFCMAC